MGNSAEIKKMAFHGIEPMHTYMAVLHNDVPVQSNLTLVKRMHSTGLSAKYLAYMIASRWWPDTELATRSVPPAVARWTELKLAFLSSPNSLPFMETLRKAVKPLRWTGLNIAVESLAGLVLGCQKENRRSWQCALKDKQRRMIICQREPQTREVATKSSLNEAVKSELSR
ncbi:hypothetical protein B0H19DRAFT_1227210 [Mycena capillaripes]|nr:hypothetical protein B0H19DRAFT_1227210 [Mycena capillaripes]